jgi:hypothetical protein
LVTAMNTSALPADVSWEANAIIERLVAPTRATFSSEDATRLISLIPVSRKPLFSTIGRFKGPGARVEGYAPGVGRAVLNGDGDERQVSLNTGVTYLVGGYRVSHAPGEVSIELMWAESRIDQTGQSCLLHYNRATKVPRRILIAEQRAVTLFIVTFAYVSYVPWKLPEASSFSSRNCS